MTLSKLCDPNEEEMYHDSDYVRNYNFLQFYRNIWITLLLWNYIPGFLDHSLKIIIYRVIILSIMTETFDNRLDIILTCKPLNFKIISSLNGKDYISDPQGRYITKRLLRTRCKDL